MAYGYNDGDQRRQSVRLAGRTTPTPRSATDSGNPQRPQEQPRSSSRQQASRTRQSGRPRTGTSAQQDSRLGARTRQRQAEVPQLRRNGARQPGIHINRFFSRSPRWTQRQALPLDIARDMPPPCRPVDFASHCALSLTCLVFVLMSSCMSHGSAGLEPTAEDKLLKAPVAPGYSFRVLDPTLAMASRHDAPYLSDRPCVVGAALCRWHYSRKRLRSHLPHHGLYL